MLNYVDSIVLLFYVYLVILLGDKLLSLSLLIGSVPVSRCSTAIGYQVSILVIYCVWVFVHSTQSVRGAEVLERVEARNKGPVLISGSYGGSTTVGVGGSQ